MWEPSAQAHSSRRTHRILSSWDYHSTWHATWEQCHLGTFSTATHEPAAVPRASQKCPTVAPHQCCWQRQLQRLLLLHRMRCFRKQGRQQRACPSSRKSNGRQFTCCPASLAAECTACLRPPAVTTKPMAHLRTEGRWWWGGDLTIISEKPMDLDFLVQQRSQIYENGMWVLYNMACRLLYCPPSSA